MVDVQVDSVACRYCPGLWGSLPLHSCAAVPRTQTQFYFSSSCSFLSQYIHWSTPHGLFLPLESKLLQGHLGKGLKQLQTDLKSAGSAVWCMTPGQRPPLSLIQSSSLIPPFLPCRFSKCESDTGPQHPIIDDTLEPSWGGFWVRVSRGLHSPPMDGSLKTSPHQHLPNILTSSQCLHGWKGLKSHTIFLEKSYLTCVPQCIGISFCNFYCYLGEWVKSSNSVSFIEHLWLAKHCKCSRYVT